MYKKIHNLILEEGNFLCSPHLILGGQSLFCCHEVRLGQLFRICSENNVIDRHKESIIVLEILVMPVQVKTEKDKQC